MTLNLGCGDNLVKGAINVDCFKGEGIDEVVDLTKFPWKWKKGSITSIYLTHVLEHFQDQKQVIQECYRILKKGGQLIITVPHSSSCMSIGCMGHYRTYSYDTLRDYLSRPFYMFKETKFKTVYQKLSWWYQRPVRNVPLWMMCFIIPMDKIFNFLAWLSPQVCENLWVYWVGGFREVLWIGEKV
jgi:SAM-dependent methyltransferase